MYELPSTSNTREPSARAMNRGVPPTPRNARTGEFTPPGMRSWARANQASDWEVFIALLSQDRARLLGNHTIQKKIQQHFAQSAVEVSQQAALQTQIWLRSGEQVLHQVVEQ